MKKYFKSLFFSSVATTSSVFANADLAGELTGGTGTAQDIEAAKTVFADIITYISWGGIIIGLLGLLGAGYAYTQGKTENGKLGLVGSLVIFSAGAIAKALA